MQLAGATLLFCLIRGIGADSCDTAEPHAETSPVKLEVVPVKKRYLRCEPVIVVVRLSNLTEHKQSVALTRDGRELLFQYTVRDPSGSSRSQTLHRDASSIAANFYY
jgi:hypothetical protein